LLHLRSLDEKSLSFTMLVFFGLAKAVLGTFLDSTRPCVILLLVGQGSCSNRVLFSTRDATRMIMRAEGMNLGQKGSLSYKMEYDIVSSKAMGLQMHHRLSRSRSYCNDDS
jgi:hypothetical protein